MNHDEHDQRLVSMPPEQAQTQFFESRKGEVRPATLENQHRPVGLFVQWCTDNDRDLNDLTGLDIQQFYDDLKTRELARTTLHHYMSTVRQFLLYLERVDVAPPGIGDKVHRPVLSKDERRRDDEIEPDRVKQIVDWLGTYKYASRDHVIMLLLWHGGFRTGSLRALDVDDFAWLEDAGPVLTLTHRPEQGTPLKNGADGERPVNLSEEVADAVQDYIDHHRFDTTDDYGREALISSAGRYSQDQIRKICLYYTCPRTTGIGSCSCEEQRTKQSAVDCEESVSPHTLRSASITYWRQQDIPVEVVSDRMDVSRQVLEEHYDRRTEEGKARQRRQYLDDV